MSQFVIITANDIHISDTSPRSRKDNFKETILGKIDQMRVACNKLNADAALIAGDLFNIKAPLKNSHATVRELIELFKQFKCPIYMIPGNHDLTGNNLESLKTQPLGVIFASDALKNLTHAVLSKKKAEKHVDLVGVPFSETIDLDTLVMPPRDADCIARVCAMHLYAGPSSGNVFEERLFGYDELAKLDADVFLLGHYHLDQGITKVGEKYFINLGAIARGTLTDENINHQPKFGYVRIEYEDSKVTIVAESIPVKVMPAEEVFDLKKRAEEVKEVDDMKKFVDHLVASTLVQVSGPEPERDFQVVIDQMDLAKAVKDKVLHYLHEAAAK